MATLTAPTLQNMIGRVRRLLNQPNRNNSFWSDEDLTDYINDAIAIYFSEVKHNNEGLFTVTTTLNVTANTETVSLPTDCFEVRALYKKYSNGWSPLPYRPRSDESYNTEGIGDSSAYLMYYFLRSNNIVLRPLPGFSETGGLQLEYISFPDVLVSGGDTLTTQIAPVFRQLIEIFAVYKAKLKESLVTGTAVHKPAEENLSTIYKLFRDAIQLRSLGVTAVKPYNPEEG